MRRRTLGSLVALAVVLVSLTLWRNRTGQQELASSPVPLPAQSPEEQTAALQSAPPGAAPAAPAARKAERRRVPLRVTPERQSFRQSVSEAVRVREQRPVSAATTASGSEPPPQADRTGTMKDRTGEMGEEVKILNREFLPLVDECSDQALERNPELHGLLALGTFFASAEGIGSIIEDVEAAPGNEVEDSELIECIRQSAFTIELPMPTKDGRKERMLTIPMGKEVEK